MLILKVINKQPGKKIKHLKLNNEMNFQDVATNYNH